MMTAVAIFLLAVAVIGAWFVVKAARLLGSPRQVPTVTCIGCGRPLVATNDDDFAICFECAERMA